MNERYRVTLLIFILAISCVTVASVAVTALYRAAYNEERVRLVETAQSQARLIEAIARYDVAQAKGGRGTFKDTWDATLSQVLDAHSRYRGFGKTGEFTLAARQGDQILFLLRHRHQGLNTPRPIPFDSELAEPMRLALLGRSGTIEGLDYRGETVLAAHEPVGELNLGIVAKIDLDEVRAPFAKAAGLALVFTLIVVLGGTTLFIKITNPVIEILRESENRYRQLFDHLSSGVAIYEPTDDGEDFLIVDMNKAGEAISRVEKKAILGRRITEVFPSVKEFGLLEVLQGVRKTGAPHRLPVSLYRDDRIFHWVENYVYSLPPGRIVAVFDDVTEQKKAEEELRESEAYMNSIFRAAPVGIGVVSNRILKRANDRFCEMVGYSPEELMDQSARILYPSDEEYDRVGREKYADIRKAGSGAIETRWLQKSGRIIDVLLSSTPIDPLNLEAGVTFTALDITERKEADQALRDSHETLLTVLDSIDATIYVADMDTHEILFMNRYMQDLYGKDLVGETCWKVFRGESGPCGHCTNDQLLAMDGNPAGVVIWEGKNPVIGRFYINHDRAIRWVNGRYVRLQVAVDITKTRELEAERRKAEAQVLRTQKMEAIGTLAGGIAHDFNNILGIIIGNTELGMLEISESAPIHHNLSEIHRASLRARDLVKQILTFSRQSEQDMIPLRLSPIVKEVLKMLRSTLPATIEIRQVIDPSSDSVVADPTQIHQILMNLCTNASYAMRERGGVLAIRLDNVELLSDQATGFPDLEPGPHARLMVSDTGTGIDPSDIERIFEPYFTTKPLGDGTGMGLALVHGIVKRHGGDIHVQSEPGKGTTFTLLFPRVKAGAAAAREGIEHLPGGHETILYVDDENAIVDMAIFMLARLGYRVIGKTKSVEALVAFREAPERFDLVITDQTMPGMTGKELAQELMAVRPDIPIILCTGFSEIIDEEKAREIGIREFIMKPLVMTDLAKSIRRILDEETP
jgi:PAS domain S-box-containing protein